MGGKVFERRNHNVITSAVQGLNSIEEILDAFFCRNVRRGETHGVLEASLAGIRLGIEADVLGPDFCMADVVQSSPLGTLRFATTSLGSSGLDFGNVLALNHVAEDRREFPYVTGSLEGTDGGEVAKVEQEIAGHGPRSKMNWSQYTNIRIGSKASDLTLA